MYKQGNLSSNVWLGRQKTREHDGRWGGDIELARVSQLWRELGKQHPRQRKAQVQRCQRVHKLEILQELQEDTYGESPVGTGERSVQRCWTGGWRGGSLGRASRAMVSFRFVPNVIGATEKLGRGVTCRKHSHSVWDRELSSGEKWTVICVSGTWRWRKVNNFTPI